MEKLLAEIRNCSLCKNHLPNKPNPVIRASSKSKIIVIGQAPGRIVDKTQIPWNDISGDNLRKWLGVDKNAFYDNSNFALMPMGFCYPGTGKNGDLPPRPECAPLWHNKILNEIIEPKLILLIGQYAQKFYLKTEIQNTLGETVKNFNRYLPDFFPLPHPSPRNYMWMKKNEWFESDVLPQLKLEIAKIIK